MPADSPVGSASHGDGIWPTVAGHLGIGGIDEEGAGGLVLAAARWAEGVMTDECF